MKNIRIPTPLYFVLAIVAFIGLTFPFRTVHAKALTNASQPQSIIERLERDSDRFRNSIDSALDRSRLNGTALEDQLNALVDEFDFATNRLRDRADDDMVLSIDVNEVLRRGMRLDMFMQTHRLSPESERDWRRVKSDLDRVARLYGVAWTWVPTRNNSALSRASTRQVLQRLEQTTDDFRESFDAGLDRSRINGSSYEDFMNNTVARFERSVDKLEEQANSSRDLNSNDVRTALNNAAMIDDFLRRQTLNARTRRDWARVKANIDDLLAFLNQVAWDWTVRSNVSPVTSGIGQARGQRVGLGAAMYPSLNALAREVRHELLSDLPYYGIFDWIEFEVLPDNTVLLRGEVVSPPDTKSRAEQVVADVDGVRRVVNEIRVLPPSPSDERLRRVLYNEIYGFNSPLFRYGIGSRQAIHIIVENGRATLKGIVDNDADRQLAYSRARSVPGLFEVTNELVVEGKNVPR